MPAKQNKISIRLDLLRPQSRPEKLPVKFLKWLLSSGRLMFIFVEALVLVAFITRFKLDADIASRNEAIEQEVPFIESLKTYEILIRQTQLKLSKILAFRLSSPDYVLILKKVADQTPLGVTIISLKLEKDVGKAHVTISAQAQNSSDVTNFVTGLKEDGYFSGVTLVSVGLEQGVTRFVINADATIQSVSEKRL